MKYPQELKPHTIEAMIQGEKERRQMNLIFDKARGDTALAHSESISSRTEQVVIMLGSKYGEIVIPDGAYLFPYTEIYKGQDVIVGMYFNEHHVEFVNEIDEYYVMNRVRELLGEHISVSSYNIDCKLTKLYLANDITWKQYVDSVRGVC